MYTAVREEIVYRISNVYGCQGRNGSSNKQYTDVREGIVRRMSNMYGCQGGRVLKNKQYERPTGEGITHNSSPDQTTQRTYHHSTTDN